MKTCWYQAVIEKGKYKNRIVAEGFANSRNKFLEFHKQSLIDAGIYGEINGIIFKKNFVIKKCWEL